MTEPKKAAATTAVTLQAQIVGALNGENPVNVERFAAYCQRLLVEVDREGKKKNPWMAQKTADVLAALFKRVQAEGLPFDGKHVTLQSTGVQFDYVAYKNKMLLAYPETTFDLNVVREGDTFSFEQSNGKVTYSHKLADAFANKEIVGAYCVIRNSRGEFLTTLSRKEIDKHRAAAKTKNVWDMWFTEMATKTVLKKATKYHFDDVFEAINEVDNEGIDLTQVVGDEKEAEAVADAIKKIEAVADLKALQDLFLAFSRQLVSNGDVFEAYNSKKLELSRV
jgi:hypothetical protein